MKKAFIFVLLVFLGVKLCDAQESAFEVLLDYSMDITCSFCSETTDGHFLVVPGKCMVLKLSTEGEVVKEMTYELEKADGEHEWTWISGLLDIPGDPSHHLAIAESYNGDTEIGNVFHVIKFDDDLNYDPDEVIIVDLSDYVKNYWHRLPPRFLLEEDGSLCFASHAVKWDDTTMVMYVRITPNGEKTVVFDDSFEDPSLEIYDFSIKDDHYGMVISFREGTPPRNYLYYCEVSRDFVSERTFCFTNGSSSQSALVYENQIDTLFWGVSSPHAYSVPEWISDSVFLLPSVVKGYPYYGTSTQDGVGVWKMDASFNLLGHAFFDVFNGNNKYEILYTWNPVLGRNNEVFFCYTTYRGTFGGPQQNVICKFDTDLNLNWKRWYGGESEYHLATGFTLTNDGGCLLSGVGHPNPSHYNDPYPYVLKITSDGYCSVKEDDEPLLKPFNCYPNPVDDILQVEYSPDVTPKAVELYDVQGRLIKTQDSNLESIGMENLPAGNYTLRVLLDDGKTYTEKVVKAH